MRVEPPCNGVLKLPPEWQLALIMLAILQSNKELDCSTNQQHQMLYVRACAHIRPVNICCCTAPADGWHPLHSSWHARNAGVWRPESLDRQRLNFRKQMHGRRRCSRPSRAERGAWQRSANLCLGAQTCARAVRCGGVLFCLARLDKEMVGARGVWGECVMS